MSEGADFALLRGARNFRAVRSYVGAGGKLVRGNAIYRSGELSRLDEGDLGVVEGLNIRLVCDLRTGREQAEFLSRWPDGHSPRRLDLPDTGSDGAGVEKTFGLVAKLPGEAGGLAAMEALYRRKPGAYLGSLARLFETILGGDAVPLLVHCHAGKDRTGFVIAMLLSALGVSRADVIEDYVETVKYFPVAREAAALVDWAARSFGLVVSLEAAAAMVDARRCYIEASFEEIEKGWGDVGGYLRAAGLDDGMRAGLRGLLLV